MLLRERVLDLARRLLSLNAFTDPDREEARELGAALDEAILGAGAFPGAFDVDRAIFNMLESEPERRFVADVIAAEVCDGVEAAVHRRLETLALRGEILNAGQGRYACRAPHERRRSA